jgi:signal transduction histidine kinase
MVSGRKKPVTCGSDTRTVGYPTAAFVLRVRQLTSRERERLEERLGERERIARELHDTLLGGVQGLILRFQAITERIPPQEQARQAFEQALERADTLLAEARDRVHNLRSTGELAIPLEQVLQSAGEQMAGGQSPSLDVIKTGQSRDLHPVVQEEVARIATEAMFNAVRHAEARRIEVKLAYNREALRVSVRDDGRGMDAALIEEGRKGHFGLIGMRERARRIKGELIVWSRPGAGTEVIVTVPAATAYVRGLTQHPFQPFAVHRDAGGGHPEPYGAQALGRIISQCILCWRRGDACVSAGGRLVFAVWKL